MENQENGNNEGEMKRKDYIHFLTELLDVAVDAGEVDHAVEICDTLYETYNQDVNRLDLLNGRALGYQIIEGSIDPNSTVFDILRDNSSFLAYQYSTESQYRRDLIDEARMNAIHFDT